MKSVLVVLDPFCAPSVTVLSKFELATTETQAYRSKEIRRMLVGLCSSLFPCPILIALDRRLKQLLEMCLCLCKIVAWPCLRFCSRTSEVFGAFQFRSEFFTLHFFISEWSQMLSLFVANMQGIVSS